MKHLMIALVASAALAGCYAEDPAVGVSYGYAAPAPSLAYVSPGVQVIADYDQPVFYSDGFYWRYDNNVWYRSGYYNRGWAVSYNVPVGVRGIRDPYYYRHYRGGGYYGGGYRPNTAWGARQGGVRVNGGYNGGYRPAPVYRGGGGYRAPARGPVVRDHRR